MVGIVTLLSSEVKQLSFFLRLLFFWLLFPSRPMQALTYPCKVEHGAVNEVTSTELMYPLRQVRQSFFCI